MVIMHARSRRKPSGGLNRGTLTKRTHMTGRPPALTRVGPERRKRTVKVKGGRRKQRLFETDVANLWDPKKAKHVKAAISAVSENPANKNFVRRNIITKGTIIATAEGRARVTNRPGQDGTVEAVLVKE